MWSKRAGGVHRSPFGQRTGTGWECSSKNLVLARRLNILTGHSGKWGAGFGTLGRESQKPVEEKKREVNAFNGRDLGKTITRCLGLRGEGSERYCTLTILLPITKWKILKILSETPGRESGAGGWLGEVGGIDLSPEKKSRYTYSDYHAPPHRGAWSLRWAFTGCWVS